MARRALVNSSELPSIREVGILALCCCDEGEGRHRLETPLRTRRIYASSMSVRSMSFQTSRPRMPVRITGKREVTELLPARRGMADFAHSGASVALACSPHVPTGDGAVGAPTLAKGEKLLGFGHVLLAVGDGPTFSHAEVVDGKDVRAAQAEDQEHLDGPGADAADGAEPFDELFVGEPLGLVVGRNHTGERFARQVFHRFDFCAGEPCFAQNRLAQL